MPMSAIDVQKLLEPISAEDPCGLDLEYDAAFGELERTAQRKPERQMGETIIPAEEPVWGDVKKKSLELLGRTKDLRIAVHLIHALVGVNGLEGLADGLELIHGLLVRHWEKVHPLLDPDDNNDPTFRVNIIASLSSPETLVPLTRQASVLSARGIGQIKVRDLLAVLNSSAAPSADDSQVDGPAIEAAFMACDSNEIQDVYSTLDRCVSSLGAIETVLVERVGAAQTADLGLLIEILKKTKQFVSDRLGENHQGEEEGDAVNNEPSSADPASTPVGSRTKPLVGDIASREDAVRMIDKVSEYFHRYEPSSPVPILLNRAKRLVSKNFFEIIEDIAPEGLAQIQKLGGIDSE